MKLTKIILALLVVILAGISLFSPVRDLTISYLLIAGALLILLGLEERSKENKILSYPLIIIGIFNFIVLFVYLLLS